MRLVNETTLTYDGLMEFNRQHQRKLLLILTVLLCVAAGLMLTSLVLSFILFASGISEPPEPSTIVAAAIGLAFSLFYILYPIIRRRKVCRKQADLHVSNTYIFTPEGFEEISYSNAANGHNVYKYDIIVKVKESAGFFYLYLNATAAFIVDKRGFTEGSEYDFRMLLRSVIDSKKLHIQ